MKDSPRISVVVPAYNAADFLVPTLKAVIAQTYQQWEMLVVDDGSSDRTSELVQQMSAADSRIRLIAQSNQGVSAARNTGVREAQSKLIAFLDADDLWLPDKLAAHVAFMEAHPKASASFARVELINFDGTSTQRFTNNFVKQVAAYEVLYANPTITTSNLVIRTAIFEELSGFDETMRHDEDVDFLFRLTYRQDFALMGIDRVLLQYRMRASGLSSNLAKMEAGWIALIEKARQQAPELIEQHYSAAHSAKLQYLARTALRLNLPATVGLPFINRAIAYRWKSLYRWPKMLVIALLIYIKLVTFNKIKLSV